MNNKKIQVLLVGFLSVLFFFSFFQSSQAGFFDWFRKNDSQEAANVVSKTKQYTLSVSKSGSGIVTSDDGKINCGKQCKVSYPASSKIVLKAEAGDNYKLERWNGCDKVSDGKCQTTLNKSKMIVTKFVSKRASSSSSQKSSSLSSRRASSSKSSSSKQTQNYKTLTIKNVFYNKGKGVVKIGDKTCDVSQCVFGYDLNKKVELQAEAESGSVLSDWGYDCDYVFAPNSACNLTMNNNKTVVVHFGQKIPRESSSKSSSSSSSSKSSSSALSVFSSSKSNGNEFVIDSCREINKSGDYILNKNLTSDKTCITIKNGKNINLDCGNYSIFSNKTETGSIKIENVDGFSIKSCDIKASIGTTNNEKEVFWDSLFVVNSSNGEISNNTIRGARVNTFSSPPEYVLESRNLKIINNNFTESYKQTYTHDSVISGNKVKIPASSTLSRAAGISSDYGSNNIIKNNNIDGSWDGISEGNSENSGVDDGILLGNESNGVVEYNTLSNFFDCGIETVGLITETKIRNNTIDNTEVCGIGGWYTSSWKNNTVEGNKITNTQRLFIFNRSFGLQPDENYVYFYNNTFKSNKASQFRYVQNKQADASGSWFLLDTSSLNSSNGRKITQADIIIENNVFTDNDFGSEVSAPLIRPLGGWIIDGGNNVCGKIPEDAKNYPLKCN